MAGHVAAFVEKRLHTALEHREELEGGNIGYVY
jgi:hypothetical protein